MKIIILNCGSSSIKYQLVEMPEKKVLVKGLVEKIGIEGSRIKHELEGGEKIVIEADIANHQKGMETVLELLTDADKGVLTSLEEIDAVGHRVVHGGEDFSGSVPITKEVVAALEECIELAPLHNPPNLEGIYTMQRLLPNVPQVGVFDTAFHQTMQNMFTFMPSHSNSTKSTKYVGLGSMEQAINTFQHVPVKYLVWISTGKK